MGAMPMKESESKSYAAPVIERLRLEPIRRNLTVKQVQSLTPRMLRITLTGEELAGFVSPSPDDHIKVFFPTADGGSENRDYTPRCIDVANRSLSIDFVLHEGGVASTWARQARPGDRLQIGGPRGSSVVSAPGASWLLIGDETALPSIGRRLEELSAGTRVVGLMAVTGPEEEQQFQTKTTFTPHWIHRPDTETADPEPVLKALSEVELAGPTFVWIAAEAEVSRAARAYVVETLQHPSEWVKASAYWSQNPDHQE